LRGIVLQKWIKGGYVFSHFIDKSPGMSASILTDFELIELNVVKMPLKDD